MKIECCFKSSSTLPEIKLWWRNTKSFIICNVIINLFYLEIWNQTLLTGYRNKSEECGKKYVHLGSSCWWA